jgi:Na+/H+-dicarboxylate symporter
MKKFPLHWQILIAFALAVPFGMYFGEHSRYISWMGVVFLRALKMVIIPLILSSIITGVTNIGNAKNLGRLGLKTITYYMVTSLLAIITGLALVNIIKPGIGAEIHPSQGLPVTTGGTSFEDTLIRMIPENIFGALSDNQQMLAVIIVALLFGFFITRVDEKPKQFLSEFFQAVFEVMMKITLFVIRFAPFGIFGLVAHKVAEQENLVRLVQSMGLYILVVIAGILIHFFITLPLITRYIGKVNPWRHFKAMRTPLITAFSTASSSATLPLTMQAVEENSGVSNKISSFTLPLGATINMDGTALYECVVAIFIAQAYGVDLSFSQQVIIVITSLLASIGAAGIPMAGLVMITVVLTAVGLPLEGIGLILAVDPFLDMFRTATNVWSDTCGAVVIAKSEGEKLKV